MKDVAGKRVSTASIIWAVIASIVSFVGLLWSLLILHLANYWGGYQGENWGKLAMIIVGFPCVIFQTIVVLPFTLAATSQKRSDLHRFFRLAIGIAFAVEFAIAIAAIVWFYAVTQ